jgi:RNA polymerase sigma-70 factor (ECF subfamily)
MSSLRDRLAHCLQEARGGSPTALGEALELCRKYLLHIALQEIHPQLLAKAGASDLVQETFAAAQRDFPNFHGTTEKAWLAWLRQILLHCIKNLVRLYKQTAKRNMAQEVMQLQDLENCAKPPLHLTTPSAEVMAAEQAHKIDQAIARLPTHYRALIHWRYRDRLSFEEMAGKINKSVDATRHLWQRAIHRLQRELVPGHA